jgi:hypothetical protein
MKKKPAAKKPAPKKGTPRTAKVKMKEHIPVVDYDKHNFSKEVTALNNKSEEKEFGTPSSPKARHDKKHPPINAGYAESQWVPNPDLDRTTTMYSGMTKRELETLGHKYGVEIDRRLKRSTIIRIIELAEEAHRKESALKEDPVQRIILQAITIGMAIGAVAGALFGYALGIA